VGAGRELFQDLDQVLSGELAGSTAGLHQRGEAEVVDRHAPAVSALCDAPQSRERRGSFDIARTNPLDTARVDA
jgi:hypothetical protein